MSITTTRLQDGLYYIHDPMCSWCWGFRPVWQQVQQTLTASFNKNEIVTAINIQYVIGGLAADTDQIMPAEMQLNIQKTWKIIQSEIPGTAFNFEFWTKNQPRRSTYPACRALIACRMQQASLEQDMLLAIQKAYYLQAKNPSDDAILLALAAEVGLDVAQFKRDFFSINCQQLLQQELSLSRRLDVSGFPSLVLVCNDSNTLINIHYTSSEAIVSNILASLNILS